MKLLVAGLTGQLGTGVLEAVADGRGGDGPLELVAVRRASSPRRLDAEQVPTVLAGDVRRPLWGLTDDDLSGPAADVDAVVNLAADTNWAAGPRDLFATNTLGAVQGYRLATELSRRAGRAVPYVYLSSVYVAGGAVGEIPERLHPTSGDRTAYERAKWQAERQLLSDAADDGRPPLLIARAPALVGNARTGRTLWRNSMYLLADRWDDFPGGLLPAMRDARVDVLPRDTAGDALLRLVRAALDRPPVGGLVCHLGLGEAAPSLRSLLAAARTRGRGRGRGEPRLTPVGARTLVWTTQNVERFLALTPAWQNTLIGLRYVGLDRVFSRPVLAGLLGADLPAVDTDLLARLIFGGAPQELDSPVGNGSMARFPE